MERGFLDKMPVAIGEPVTYELPLGEQRVPLNPLIGKHLSIRFTGNIRCEGCGRSIKKTYSDGYCFPCTQRLACCDFCILKPETCHYHLGTCREPEWGERNCMTDHFVYLADSCGLKVGITRHSNIPTRWIDQGAHQAIPIFRVDTRRLSGLIEAALKAFVSDRTDWRKMLRNQRTEIDLEEARDALFDESADIIDSFLREYGDEAVEVLDEEPVTRIDFPVTQYPEKVRSRNFDKTPMVEGELWGVKGQYLILSSGVLNIRKFSAYEVEFETA